MRDPLDWDDDTADDDSRSLRDRIAAGQPVRWPGTGREDQHQHTTTTTTTITVAAELLGIAELAGLLRLVLRTQGVLMSTVDDLRRAVAANNAADDAIITEFQALRAQLAALPADRPLNADEQAALDEAVGALEARTAAMLDAMRPTTTPPAGPIETTTPAPVSVTGGQGGTVDLTGDGATPASSGVPGAIVDLSSSTPTSVVADPIAGHDPANNTGDDTAVDDDEPTDPAETPDPPATPLSENDTPFPSPAGGNPDGTSDQG